jgi:hypothetical protein
VVRNAIKPNFHSLNRVGSRIARPERPEREISPTALFSLPLVREAAPVAEIVRSKYCSVVLSDPVLESCESCTLRPRVVFVYTLFRGISTPLSSIGLFLERTIGFFAF